MTVQLVVLTDFYFPATAAGGPPKGIRAALQDQPELDIRVFCRDRDHLATTPFGAPHRGTVTVDTAEVTYLPLSSPRSVVRGLLRLLTTLSRADVVWVNSLHSRLFVFPWLLGLTLLRAAIIVSPRGELASSAIESGHPHLKRCWHRMLRLLRVDRRVLWLASSQRESADIVGTFPRASVFLMPEISLFTQYPLHHRSRQAELRLLSLGRICPIKGLDIGLRVLSHVKAPIRLDVVGPIEDRGHFDELQRMAATLASHLRVQWHGPVDTAEVPKLIRASDALFNPTRGENFGHAIAESLALGRPAFIGPGTPWSFAESSGAVVVLDPTRPEKSAEKVDRFAAQSADEAAAAQQSARQVGLVGLQGHGDLTTAVLRARAARSRR